MSIAGFVLPLDGQHQQFPGQATVRGRDGVNIRQTPGVSYIHSMKIVITGANGLLGQHLVQLLLATTTHTVTAMGRGNCRLAVLPGNRFVYIDQDLTDGAGVSACLAGVQPDVVIHAAAKTQADDCEKDPIGCWAANVTATRLLIAAVQAFNPFFVFLSTDFVFDGLAGPYTETDTPGPVNYYGSSKVAGEKEVLQCGLAAAVVRTCLVYGDVHGASRSHFIGWVRENLEAGKRIKVVDDQWRTPTSVQDLAQGILQLVEQRATGLFHLSGAEVLTPYQMALAVADFYALDRLLIERTTAGNFTQPAQRPRRTGFVIDKAIKLIGFQPVSFAAGLQRIGR